MSNIVDLNELSPESRIIRIGTPAREITLQSPKMGDLIELSKLGKEMESVNKEDIEAMASLMEKMYNLLCKIIPELSEVSVNPQQMVKIFEILADMAMPKDASALQNKGITEDSVKKDQ